MYLFNKSGDIKILFGYELEAEFEIVNVAQKGRKRTRKMGELMHAYQSKLPISESNCKDLVKLF